MSCVHFYDRPMFKWRCIVTAMCLMLFLSLWGVLGFHEPAKPLGAIVVLGTGIVWCICDAVDTLIASGTLTEGGDVEQAPGDSLSGPTGNAGDAQ